MLERALGGSVRLWNDLTGSRWARSRGLDQAANRFLFRGAERVTRAAREAAGQVEPLLERLEPRRMKGAEARPRRFDPTLDEEQQLVRDSMLRFAREQVAPAARAADAAAAPPMDLMQEAHELGVVQLAVPEAMGGAGEQRSPVQSVVVAEALAYGDMGLALGMLSPASLAHALVQWGSGRQQQRWLPPLIDAQFYPAACALLEPGPLFDAYRLRTQARLDEGGYRLDGEKHCVALGREAKLFLVSAALDGAPCAFLVQADAPGLSVEAQPSMGLRGAGLCRLQLAGVRVSRDALLGEGEDFDHGQLVDLARIGWGALSVGCSQAALDYLIPYCNERVAFGEPISHRQAVAFTIADMATEIEGMRMMVQRAASRAEQGLAYRREAYLARVLCVEQGMQVGTDAVQLLGGHGFTQEHPAELWYRNLRAAGVVEGAILV